MKKLITVLSLLLVLCKVVNAQNVVIENNYIKFPTLQAYEQYAENTLNRADISNLAISSNVVTTLEEDNYFKVNDTLYPEFYHTILNTDKIFQLGIFLVKIDLENNRSLVLDAGQLNAYYDLMANNLNANGLMLFTTEDDYAFDVLEAVTNGSLQKSNYRTELNNPNGLFRKCSGAPRYKDNATEDWGTVSGDIWTCTSIYGPKKTTYLKETNQSIKNSSFTLACLLEWIVIILALRVIIILVGRMNLMQP